ncbi:hypothetical protein L873DRAFT_1702188, partial [Choiromyces venosus 120613-1]
SIDPTAELLEPLTSTLGPFICNASTPWAEGTGGFYVTDDKSNLYLVTARHVVFKQDQDNNDMYECKNSSEPRVDIALFGTAAFTNYVKQIKHVIEAQNVKIEFEERRAKEAAEGDNGMDIDEAMEEHADAERLITEAKDATVAFEKLYDDVVKGWSNIENRVLGFVVFSPPIEIRAGPNNYTQDYALIRIDSSKIDAANFTGNAIDLGTKIPSHKFRRLMFPQHTNSHTFKYPANRLFKVQGMVLDKEMRHPTIMDENGGPCLLVMKRGNTTGLTVGRANDILSFVRNYFDNGETKTSKEWAIYPYDNKSGPFAAKGDSGSAIVDCLGRLGGLITAGGGLTDPSDITYATPISFIIGSLKANGYKVTTEATLTA